MTEREPMPATYDEFVAYVMKVQRPTAPAFKTEAECRAEMARMYPGLEERYEFIRDLENGVVTEKTLG